MLLQITAPDASCGLVFVRGRFANNAGSILARAQGSVHQKSKDLFGARLARATAVGDIEYGAKKAQGWINFRWPYLNYELRRKDCSSDRTTGSYEQITFVRDGVVFQVVRIRWGSESSISDDEDAADMRDTVTVKIQTGGRVRFGCPCSATRPTTKDSFELGVGKDQGQETLACTSSKYEKRLETQIFVNGVSHGSSQEARSIMNAEAADTTTVHNLEVSFGQPTYIVYALALREAHDPPLSALQVRFTDIEDYLGVDLKSANMTDRLWTGLCSPNYEGAEAVELCAVGRCVEQILGVAAIPHSPESLKQGSEIALVQTIMTPQFVDVQSAL